MRAVPLDLPMARLESRHGQTREPGNTHRATDLIDGSRQPQMLVGRADNSGTRGFGCWLWISRPHATSSYTVGMRLAGRHLTCPTVIHPSDHLLSRVPPRYARAGAGSTEFTECGPASAASVGNCALPD